MKRDKKSVFFLIIGILLLCGLYILLSGIFPKKPTPTNTNENISKSVAAECAANAPKYDKKILKITGENIKGSIYVKANLEKCRIEATFIILLAATLAEHRVDNLPYLYNYTGLLLTNGKKDDYHGTGVLSPAYKNQNTLPTPGLTSQEIASYYIVSGVPTNTTSTQSFYANFERWQDLTESGYRKLFDYTQYAIIDTVDYQIKKSLSDGAVSYTTDTDKAYKEGKIYKSFSFTISE